MSPKQKLLKAAERIANNDDDFSCCAISRTSLRYSSSDMLRRSYVKFYTGELNGDIVMLVGFGSKEDGRLARSLALLLYREAL